MTYIEESTKLPKGIRWLGKFKADAKYNIVKLGITEKDAYFVLTSRLNIFRKKVIYVIKNFRETTYTKVYCEIYDYFQNDAYATPYPLGRNFDDALMHLYEHGMRQGFVKPITRPTM